MEIESIFKESGYIKDRGVGRIGVLLGGPSSEREISLRSGQAVYRALCGLGLDAVAIDIETAQKQKNIQLIQSHKIGCAFLALHGRFGEDGQIQELLEGMDIPYTGSGVAASRLAMDKVASRKVFEASGLKVPRYAVFKKPCAGHRQQLREIFHPPLVVKPATHGSSIGLSIIDDIDDLGEAAGLAFSFDEVVIIEEYICGRELTVGILDEAALPAIEIIPKKRFFDYEAKYQPGMTEYIVPAQLPERLSVKLAGAALSAHKLLGCSGCSRVDMILGTNSEPFVLEVNTIPGFTETSLLPKSAKVAGVPFPELCLRLIQLAYEKKQPKFS